MPSHKTKKPCCHCGKNKGYRPGGLCSACYFTPEIREQYPGNYKYSPKEEETLEDLERLIDEQMPTMPNKKLRERINRSKPWRVPVVKIIPGRKEFAE